MGLIEAKELKRKILDETPLPDWVQVLVNRVIDDMPAVDAEPVKHGHWNVMRNAYGRIEGWMCSNPECETEVCIKSNFCPNCGAKMDEVK